jgi:hypothetical protein
VTDRVEGEWVGDDEELRSFLIVCTGGGRHAERTLVEFPVSRRWGMLAGITARGANRGSRKPSYQVVSSKGTVTHRAFHCRTCGSPFLFKEEEFIAGIEYHLAEAGDLAARRLDLSAEPPRLL